MENQKNKAIETVVAEIEKQFGNGAVMRLGAGEAPAPEPRDVRYQLLTPFRAALQGVVDDAEIESLIENAPGVGLRLNVAGGAEVSAPAVRMSRSKAEARSRSRAPATHPVRRENLQP